MRRVERVPEPFLTYVEGPDPAHDPAAPPQRQCGTTAWVRSVRQGGPIPEK